VRILAVDTALGACSCAVLEDTNVHAHRFTVMERGHAEALAPMVEDAMRESGIAFAELDRLAVTTGPGTFTGQRIGLAFMRGMRIALKRPLIGITTLEAMACMDKGSAHDRAAPRDRARAVGCRIDHPDAEELYRRASAIDPHISIATVYRTVKLFEDAGILERHDFRDGRSRYEEAPENASRSSDRCADRQRDRIPQRGYRKAAAPRGRRAGLRTGRSPA
jgi:tRNA threonylcarbamoyl adenosine modification protein YeaZ